MRTSRATIDEDLIDTIGILREVQQILIPENAQSAGCKARLAHSYGDRRGAFFDTDRAKRISEPALTGLPCCSAIRLPSSPPTFKANCCCSSANRLVRRAERATTSASDRPDLLAGLLVDAQARLGRDDWGVERALGLDSATSCISPFAHARESGGRKLIWRGLQLTWTLR